MESGHRKDLSVFVMLLRCSVGRRESRLEVKRSERQNRNCKRRAEKRHKLAREYDRCNKSQLMPHSFYYQSTNMFQFFYSFLWPLLTAFHSLKTQPEGMGFMGALFPVKRVLSFHNPSSESLNHLPSLGQF